jgi:hypothetical protein
MAWTAADEAELLAAEAKVAQLPKAKNPELSLGESVMSGLKKLPGQALGAAVDVAKAIPGAAYEVIKPDFMRTDEERRQRAQNAQNIVSGVGALAGGAMQQVRNLSPEQYRGSAPAYDTSAIEGVENALYDRYGNYRNIKNTMANDLGGMALDVGTIVAPALGTVGRLGRTGEMVATAGRAVNPVTLPQKTAALLEKAGGFVNRKAVEPIVSNTLGFTTGAEAGSIREAAKAGYGSIVGGEEAASAAKAFQDQLRVNFKTGASPRDALDLAQSALENAKKAKIVAYNEGIAKGIGGKTEILDFAPIDTAIGKAAEVGSFKGKTLSPSAQKVKEVIQGVVDDWRNSNPAEYHTAEGLDALKRKIGNLAYEEDLAVLAKPGSPGSKIVGDVYNAVKQQIVDKYPEYAEVMKDFMEADDLHNDVQRAFSLGDKASSDTAIRKLQSILRNNVSSNQSARPALAQYIIDNGAKNLMPTLAGQSLSAPLPRGAARIATGVAGGTGFGIGGIPALMNPLALAGLASTSPRLVGEGAYYAGKAAGVGRKALDASKAAKLAELLRNNKNAVNISTLAAGQATRPNYEEIP